jgi:hypothetical protein
MSLKKKIVYGRKVLPGGTWRALRAPVRGAVHLIIAVADHFEPAIDPESGGAASIRRQSIAGATMTAGLLYIHIFIRLSNTIRASSKRLRTIATLAGAKSRCISITECLNPTRLRTLDTF